MQQGLLLDSLEFKKFLNTEDFLGSLQQMVNKHLLMQLIAVKELGDDENLFKDMKFDERNSLIQEFSAEYSLSYYGEILERFDEKNIHNSNKDLFTLLFATIHISKYFKFYSIGAQEDIFKNKVSSIIVENGNLTNKIALLTYITCWENIDLDIVKILTEDILNNMHTSSNLFEVLSAISIISYCKEECILDELNFPQNLDHIVCKFLSEDMDVFKQKEEFLRSICNLYNLLGKPKARDYENRKFAPFLKSMNNLSLKGITNKDVENITNLWNINQSKIFYLNFIATQLNINDEKDAKVSLNGYGKIAMKAFKDAFESEDLIEEYVIDLIKKQRQLIRTNSVKDSTAENRTKAFLFNLFHMLDEPKNILNLEILFDVLRHFDKNLEFKLKHKYLLREDCFEFVPKKYKSDLCKDILSLEKSKEDFEKTYNHIVDNNYEKNIYEYFSVVRNGINVGYINPYDFNEINKNEKLAINCYSFINSYKQEPTMRTIEYATEYMKAVSPEKVNIFVACEILRINYERESDEQLREFLPLLEEMYFCHEVSKYEKFVYEIYTNEKYLNILNISEEDLSNIYEFFIDSDYIDEEEKFKLQQYFATDLEKESMLMDKEIESIINGSIRNGYFGKYGLLAKIKSLNYIKEEKVQNALIDALVLRISHYQEYSIPAFYYLNKIGVLTTEKLIKIMETISKNLHVDV